MEMQLFLSIVLAGIVGTTAMVLVMGLIHGLRWAEADMVRAIGSVYTRNLSNAFSVGLVIHYTAGIIFSFFYAVMISIAPLPPDSKWSVLLVSILFGIFHGLIVSMGLVIVVAEHHPIERFRKAGLGVVVSHLIGHLVYGTFVGLVFVLSGVRTNFLQN